MNKFKMRLCEAPYRAIERGEKKIERRLFDEKRRELKVGDVIEFSLADSDEKLERTIVGLHVFPSFAAMWEQFPDELGKGPESMYEYYSAEDEAKYCVVAIALE